MTKKKAVYGTMLKANYAAFRERARGAGKEISAFGIEAVEQWLLAKEAKGFELWHEKTGTVIKKPGEPFPPIPEGEGVRRGRPPKGENIHEGQPLARFALYMPMAFAARFEGTIWWLELYRSHVLVEAIEAFMKGLPEPRQRAKPLDL